MLVVDDDLAIREVVSEVLRDEGYDVTCAADGVQAMDAMRRAPRPDLVLLDLMMPVMSGWEVLEQVHDDSDLSRVPIVVVSAMTAPGGHEHLSKPIDLDRLLATVKRLAS